MNKGPVIVQLTVRISNEQIRDLLSTALEGGINYWADYEAGYTPQQEAMAKKLKGVWEGLPVYFIEDTEYKLVIKDMYESKAHELTYDRLRLGLVDMADKYPVHMQKLLTDEFDAETGDVFIQCCVFGDIIYG